MIEKSTETLVDKIYQVKTLPVDIDVVQNVWSLPDWENANVEDGFYYPWEELAAPKTAFRALCDKKYLYFIFDVHDTSVVVHENISSQDEILSEDRVEIFLSSGPDLSKYYTLEIDPYGRVFSASAAYYRKFDYDWRMRNLYSEGVLTAEGYVVKGAISLDELRDLGVQFNNPGDIIYAGLYRADFKKSQSGDFESHWISWVSPDHETPEFHIPSSFGMFVRV